jgi:hypothetical protein
MQDESDIVSGGWEAVTVDMEKWNLLVCQLESLVDIDCFIHCNHAKSILLGVESPTFEKKHRHSVQDNSPSSINKKRGDISTPSMRGEKTSDRLTSLSVQGIPHGKMSNLS